MAWPGTLTGGLHLHMQAGAAWPKLKPFVLELLTTLIGKQVRHKCLLPVVDLSSVFSAFWDAMGLEKLEVMAVSSIWFPKTINWNKSIKRHNVNGARTRTVPCGNAAQTLQIARTSCKENQPGHVSAIVHVPHPTVRALMSLPHCTSAGVERRRAVEGLAAGGGAGGAARLSDPTGAAAERAGKSAGSDAAGRGAATQGCPRC